MSTKQLPPSLPLHAHWPLLLCVHLFIYPGLLLYRAKAYRAASYAFYLGAISCFFVKTATMVASIMMSVQAVRP